MSQQESFEIRVWRITFGIVEREDLAARSGSEAADVLVGVRFDWAEPEQPAKTMTVDAIMVARINEFMFSLPKHNDTEPVRVQCGENSVPFRGPGRHLVGCWQNTTARAYWQATRTLGESTTIN